MTNKNSLTRDLDECDFMDLFSTSRSSSNTSNGLQPKRPILTQMVAIKYKSQKFDRNRSIIGL